MTEAYCWVPSSMGMPVPNAVPGRGRVDRRDSRELVTYVGRVEHEGDVLPGTVYLHFNCIEVLSRSGKRYEYQHYEVLTLNPGFKVGWKPGQNGLVDNRAIECGKTAEGEKLYIGKVKNAEGEQLYTQVELPILGKVQPSHGSIYWVFNNEQCRSHQYDVLIQKESKSTWKRIKSAGGTVGTVLGPVTDLGLAVMSATSMFKSPALQSSPTSVMYQGRRLKVVPPK